MTVMNTYGMHGMAWYGMAWYGIVWHGMQNNDMLQGI
jgi:hypothetical protein